MSTMLHPSDMRPQGHDCGCGCDIPAFCRSSYYRGKLLTERDFADEQRYLIDKMRLHALALHGWGVVCGMGVKPHPYCPQLRLVIEDGLAMDSCGREIRVLREATIDLPQPPPKPPAPPKDIEPKAPGAPPAADDCEPEPPAQTFYLCIAYSECGTEFGPAPFDDCGCSTGGLKANRICESFKLELHDTKPDFWDAAVGMACEAEDCRDYYREGAGPCHTPGRAPCVPLAVIFDVIPGQPVTKEQIRVHGHRRQLASTETLDRVVRCILEKLPAETLTRIDDTNWEHGQRYLCREFMSEFVSSDNHPRGFRIHFTDRVNAEKIDLRTFQALVVFRSDDPAQPRLMEVAPAEIHKDEGETDWCRLQINPVYARNRLDMRDFDLFITLRCDSITDRRDLAVDGDFIASRFPTGNNVQGGTFESWIRVRPRHASN